MTIWDTRKVARACEGQYTKQKEKSGYRQKRSACRRIGKKKFLSCWKCQWMMSYSTMYWPSNVGGMWLTPFVSIC
jgi:hypothetical protein